MAKKVIILGDTHCPWTNVLSLNEVYRAITKIQPDVVVQSGDLFDMYSFSKFARSHDLCTPSEEILEGRKLAEAMWKNIRSFAPKAECYQIFGNHDIRPNLRLQEKYPEIASIVDMSDLWKFPGVTTVSDARDELEIDNVLYIHGHYSKLGDHMRYYHKNVVCGHSHQGGVQFWRRGTKTLWELNAGYLADENAVPLKYTKTKTTKWTQGYGLIDELGPRFIPLKNK